LGALLFSNSSSVFLFLGSLGALLFSNASASSFFRGPEGRFVCQETHYPHKVFIATGAGIAPIMSMISDRVTTTDKIQLLFGVRAEEDIFWTERLQAWEKVSANFSFILTLSQPSSMWSGKTGRVVDYITSFVQTSLIEYYLCGSLDMVKDARVNLVGQGISTKNIHLEIF
jgi:CDP-4-dehydro-6-deoxyglucose reductase